MAAKSTSRSVRDARVLDTERCILAYVEAACEIAVINCLYNPIHVPLTRLLVQSPVQEHGNEITGVAVFNTLRVLGSYSAASN